MAFHLAPIDKLSIILMSKWSKILLIGILVTFFIFIMFARVADFDTLTYWFNNTSIVSGYVHKVIETNYTVNDRPVIQYFFTFQLDDQTLLNHSYSSRLHFQSGQEVDIEYIVRNPEVSRIAGTKNAQFQLTSLLISGIILVILAILAWKSYCKSKKVIGLLHNRVPDIGEYLSKTETMTTINDRILYKIQYEYYALDVSYVKEVFTTYPEDYGSEEPLFYSKNRPEQAVLYRELPKRLLSKLNVQVE